MPSTAPPAALGKRELKSPPADLCGRRARSSSSCCWNFSRARASRLLNSVGMCLPSKDLRTSRVSLKPIAATYSKKGINETRPWSFGSPFHFGTIIAFSG